MFLAMNRFKIAPGKEQEFTDIWKNRDTFLNGVPGFKTFNLMAGPVTDEYALFVSHSVWESRQSFEDWTRSEAFRKAHANAGVSRDIYMGPPKLELFESIV